MNFKEIFETLELDLDQYIVKDSSLELWREYEHGGVIFRIDNPICMIIRKGGTTHRIIDDKNVSHCHPIPGNGCALRWFNGENKSPVQF